jgi:hypothetical protein
MNRASQQHQVVITAEERLSRQWVRASSISIIRSNRADNEFRAGRYQLLEPWVGANERQHDQQLVIHLVQSNWMRPRKEWST